MRPEFAGLVGVNLEKQSKSKNEDIINDEAYVLGKIHSRSISHPDKFAKDLENVKSDHWKEDVGFFVDFCNTKFNELKP